MGAIKKKYLPNYTYEDYSHWEGSWELINGVPYAMSPAPTGKHQWISTKILTQLERDLNGCESCHVSIPMDWKVDENTVLQPDLFVACFEFKSQKFLDRSPHLIVEVLSPSTREKDLHLKFSIYEEKGVKYYIIIDPEDDSWTVYQLIGKKYKKVKHSDCKFTFEFEDNCSADVDLSKVF